MAHAKKEWLLLIHQIPPKPGYFRVKVWRRLQPVGAVAVKQSVYALPKTLQASEDFAWISKEIAEGGCDRPENLKRQFEVYDALYVWRRLDVAKSAIT